LDDRRPWSKTGWKGWPFKGALPAWPHAHTGSGGETFPGPEKFQRPGIFETRIVEYNKNAFLSRTHFIVLAGGTAPTLNVLNSESIFFLKNSALD